MRRIFHMLMCFTLVVATTGISISKHFCGSALVRTSLGTEVKSCMPGMDMDTGCCDEKTETLVLDDDYQLVKHQIDIAPEYDLLIAYLVTETVGEDAPFDTSLLYPVDTGPPVEADPLYLMVQSFLL